LGDGLIVDKLRVMVESRAAIVFVSEKIISNCTNEWRLGRWRRNSKNDENQCCGFGITCQDPDPNLHSSSGSDLKTQCWGSVIF
jgi:hypothetical protein